MVDILLITPPFTQLNTPYPATAYLKGFLNTKGITSSQMDLGIEVILSLFSKGGLASMFDYCTDNESATSENSRRIMALKEEYLKTIDSVVAFLQGDNQSFARQITSENCLPQASRFDQISDLDWAFGTMGFQDRAKHLATLYLEDLSDFIAECVDSNFGFSRYAERLGRSANSFDELYAELHKELTYVDKVTLSILEDKLKSSQPKIVALSVPFPGNLYSAFRCAQFIKERYPAIKIAMGGGFPNTELRSLTDVRVFEFVDFITLDDGELPTELVFKAVASNAINGNQLKRTFISKEKKVIYIDTPDIEDYKQNDLGTPDYSDLLLDKYISVIEVTNPMHSLWSDGRWNKLTIAHGCYWGKCTFCDGSLPYIKKFDPIDAKVTVDRMEEIIKQTGETGFHFVDEGAPPALMRAIAIEIIRRNLMVTWWTNIRFEKSFTKELCKLLKASGCIAISGGLEVASERLLKLINKGVTVEQVALVTNNFTEVGIMVHTYLMYGYPSQTIQETVDSLEMVRQMFELGIIQSGFWHQFALTAHSPVGLNPDKYHIIPDFKTISFANNDVQFIDKTGIDHSKFSFGLKKSLFNYMHGIGFEMPLQSWFDFKIPKSTIKPHYIEQTLDNEPLFNTKESAQIIWLGVLPEKIYTTKTKRGVTRETVQLIIYDKSETIKVTFDKASGDWLAKMLAEIHISTGLTITYIQLKESFEEELENFELFWYSKQVNTLRDIGLLVL